MELSKGLRRNPSKREIKLGKQITIWGQTQALHFPAANANRKLLMLMLMATGVVSIFHH